MKTKETEIMIDGALGEGGGQIIRTSLALSMVTGRPVRIHRIRAKRKKPGLLRQHLTALNAAVEICNAEVSGNELGSGALTFRPGAIRGGNYTFRIGTAGSTSLVLQTLLPALMVADEPSEIVIEGGTHNPFSPPFTFLEKVFAPLINRMGPALELKLEQHGFYPAGGGRMIAQINPCRKMQHLNLMGRTPHPELSATALCCGIPETVGERELKKLGSILDIPKEQLMAQRVKANGAGNALMCAVSEENITELFTEYGERGVTAEQVAIKLAREVKEHLNADVPVGPHLADQLMIPMAMAGAGSFRTTAPTLHSTTNLEIINRFYDHNMLFEQESELVWRFEVR
ncbi:MAG: RNA 3'-terminal phosphate cyclase [Pontiellaceae bacterium]|nr:RNA 3'-terminal phosphate cyclase [Pontiellaceae bacterium]MBN2785729.1 RNA 3'-terminal phosphate cyclase [Pontiellaceae bacterium]